VDWKVVRVAGWTRAGWVLQKSDKTLSQAHIALFQLSISWGN